MKKYWVSTKSWRTTWENRSNPNGPVNASDLLNTLAEWNDFLQEQCVDVYPDSKMELA